MTLRPLNERIETIMCDGRAGKHWQAWLASNPRAVQKGRTEAEARMRVWGHEIAKWMEPIRLILPSEINALAAQITDGLLTTPEAVRIALGQQYWQWQETK